MNTEDTLEKQLATLFSDAVLPEITGISQRRRLVLATATVGKGTLPISIGVPFPTGPGRLLKPGWLPRPRWIVGTLATVPMVIAMASLLADQGNTARRFNAGVGPASQVIAGAAANAPATPLTTPLVVTEGSLVIRTPAPFSTATASAPVALDANETELFPSAEPTRAITSAGAGESEPLASLTPSPTAEPTATLAPSPTAEPTATLASSPTAEPTATLAPSPAVEPTVVLVPSPTATGAPSPTAPPTPAPTATAIAPGPASSSETRLVIPAINLEAPVVTVGSVKNAIDGQTSVSWAVPEYYAVGWHHTSAPPGQAGNTVLNGHQSLYGSVFRNLISIDLNDEIIIRAAGTTHHYRVAERHMLPEEGQPLSVRAANARWILPTGDERLTLVTCAPDGKTTHRLIVVAFPIQPDSSLAGP